jgi:rubrerythrin
MTLHTASEVISFARELEEESAKFYTELAETYPQDKDMWLLFARENPKYTRQIQQAYYGVISDAIEGCFAFEVEPEKYELSKALFSWGKDRAESLSAAVLIEETVMQFYLDAAAQSKALMADVPRTFSQIAKKRMDRIGRLKALR